MSRNKTPHEALVEKSMKWGLSPQSFEFAKRLDEEDTLSQFRKLFSIPRKVDLPFCDNTKFSDENEESIYLCGQSMGLKPRSVDKYIQKVLDNWGKLAVHSHFTGYLPAALSDLSLKTPMAKLVGAKTSEVAVMNGLTVNLHILLSTFYKPTAQRHKIIIEEHAFSSDMYAVKSHLIMHGYSPETSLLLLKPRQNEHLFREEDILDLISREGDQVAVILLFGLQYYTGQLMNVPKITAAAHEKGIIVGFDGAHSVGNVMLRLHDWNVDFACWCTYKYLNSGAGCLGGLFVHEKITEKGGNSQIPMLKGWWGNNPETKFLMKDDFDAAVGADMFRLSNPPPVLVACVMASLDIFSQTSMEELTGKQFLLTGYLEYLLRHRILGETENGTIHENGTSQKKKFFKIITPGDPKERGSQLSLLFNFSLVAVQRELQKHAVVCDIRMPNVMRVAPVPLYNSFKDVYTFVNILGSILNNVEKCDNDDLVDNGPHNEYNELENGDCKSE